MKRTKLTRVISIILAIISIVSIGCTSAFAKGKSALVGCATEGAATGQAATVYVYSFPYFDSQTPQIEGKTMSVYSPDGIYLGETGPLHKDSRYTDVFDATKPIYTFQWEGKTRLFQPSGSFVVPESDVGDYLKK